MTGETFGKAEVEPNARRRKQMVVLYLFFCKEREKSQEIQLRSEKFFRPEC